MFFHNFFSTICLHIFFFSLLCLFTFLAVPIREDGMYFYRCREFCRRPIWVFLFKWDGYMFRFIVKKVNSKQIGRGDNDSKIKDFIISHIQFVGVESLAGKYAYIITIFEAKSRKRSHEFQGIVTSTLNSTIEECVKNSSNCGKTYNT